MSKKHKMIFVATALVLQLLVLGWLILRYERLVSQGIEVRFQCQAYDPYDPFLGRYLNTRVEEEVDIQTEQDSDNRFQYACLVPKNDGSNLYCVKEVAKTPHDDGLWVRPEDIRAHMKTIHREKGEDEESFENRLSQAGYVARVRFPSKLYVNEKLARKADQILRDNTENAVAVYRVKDHEMVLIDIEIDGESIQKLAK